MTLTLVDHPQLSRRRGPVVLCILDGVGIGKGQADDAVVSARTPNLDRLRKQHPQLALQAHGTHVGMPSDSDLGNSEVGHNAMGAGRVFDQGAKLVDMALGSGSAFESEVWQRLTAGKTMHLLGLLSDGNVHSHVDHLTAMIERAARDGVKRLRIHLLSDGRDVPGRSALTWVRPLEALLARCSEKGRDYRVASGGGRMLITMDRYEADWSMVERGWHCHVLAEGPRFESASAAIEAYYADGSKGDDQYLPSFVVEGCPEGIVDGDSVLLFNFRGDRALEITRAFEDDSFSAFERVRRPAAFYAGMMQYDGDLMLPAHFLVTPPQIERTVGQYLVANRRKTFACSETQKFGHVTYFYNGNRSGYLDETLETYCEIPSDVVPFDERPWMKAAEISDAAVQAITSGKYDVVRLNYPNGDMVGHTGDLEATRIAIEVVDQQLARLEKAVIEADGVLLITADHGNADEMYLRKGDKVLLNDDGEPEARTSHSTNPVPLVIVDPQGVLRVADGLDTPGIAQLGATILALCGLTPPADYLPSLVAVR